MISRGDHLPPGRLHRTRLAKRQQARRRIFDLTPQSLHVLGSLHLGPIDTQ